MRPRVFPAVLVALQASACVTHPAAGPSVASFHESLRRCLDGVPVTLYGTPGHVAAASTLRIGRTLDVVRATGAESSRVFVSFEISYADAAFTKRLVETLPARPSKNERARYRRDGDRYVFDSTFVPTVFRSPVTLVGLAMIPDVTNPAALLNARLRDSCPPVALDAEATS